MVVVTKIFFFLFMFVQFIIRLQSKMCFINGILSCRLWTSGFMLQNFSLTLALVFCLLQAKANGVPSCVIIIRVFRDMKDRLPSFTPLSSWVGALLLAKKVV